MAGGREINKLTPDGLFGALSSVSCGAFVLATDQTLVFWNRRAGDILGYNSDRVVGRRCSGIAGAENAVALTDDCSEGCMMVRTLRAGLVPGRSRLRMRCAWGEWKWLVVTPMVVSGLEDGGPLLVYLFGNSGDDGISADIRRLVELGAESGRGLADGDYASATDSLAGPRDEDGPSGDVDPGVQGTHARQLREGSGGEDRYTVRPTPSAASGESDADTDQGGPPRRSARQEERRVNLTRREREVLSYLALGWETKYIAEELNVSWYTARNHVENLRRKLGASNRLEAVLIAMRLGIIPSE